MEVATPWASAASGAKIGGTALFRGVSRDPPRVCSYGQRWVTLTGIGLIGIDRRAQLR
jgi:hypothetical protein